jgi:hypothetical protein
VSKRHQSTRRKTYGRRQHEIRERFDRQHLPEHDEVGLEWEPAPAPDPFSFLDPRTPRLRFALD